MWENPFFSQLGFQPEFLGRLRLAGSVASLAGVALYNGCLRTVPLKTIFVGTAVAGCAASATKLALVLGLNRAWGVSDAAFALADGALITVLGQVAFMPTLVLAAAICPVGVEASLFAALMSVFNAAGAASGAMGAGLAGALNVKGGDYSGLPTLVAICALSPLLALPCISLLDGVPLAGVAEGEAAERDKGDEVN